MPRLISWSPCGEKWEITVYMFEESGVKVLNTELNRAKTRELGVQNFCSEFIQNFVLNFFMNSSPTSNNASRGSSSGTFGSWTELNWISSELLSSELFAESSENSWTREFRTKFRTYSELWSEFFHEHEPLSRTRIKRRLSAENS